MQLQRSTPSQKAYLLNRTKTKSDVPKAQDHTSKKAEIHRTPFHAAVEERYLYSSDSSLTDLGKLLIGMGCHILNMGSESQQKTVTNDEYHLGSIIESAIRDFSEGYERNSKNALPELTAGKAIGEYKEFFLDENDFIEGTDKLRPISIHDMLDFFGKLGLMRAKHPNGEKLRGETSERDPIIFDLQNRISATYQRLAKLIAMGAIHDPKKTPHAIEIMLKKGKENMRKNGISLPNGSEINELNALFKGKNFGECCNILSIGFGVKPDVIFTDPNIIELFAEIRTLSRRLNQLIGINTIDEIQSETAKAIAELQEEERKKKKWMYKESEGQQPS